MILALTVLIAIAAMFGAGVLATVEAAVDSVSKARVEEMLREERSGAGALLRVLDDRARHISVLVLLRSVCEMTAATLVTVLAIDHIAQRSWAITAAVAALTLFTFIVLGVTTRTLGRKNPYSISLASAMVLSLVGKLLGPVEKVLIWLGNVLTPGGGFRDGPFGTEVELREMVDIAQERGIVEIDERRMIQSVFDLASTSARAVMVPRPEMVWIESDKHCGQAVALCVRSGHSRIPVVGESVDDIVGILYLKDIVQRTYARTDGGRGVPVSDVMRQPVFVPDSKPLDDLLDEMQRDRNHIAVLIDEYGGVAGLISIEDILEEIVGEIADEYDTAEIAPIEPLGNGSYRVVSRLGLGELAELYDENHGFEIEYDEEIEEDVDTVSGLLAYLLGRVPLPGVHVEYGGLRFTAEGARDRRGRMRVHSVVTELLQPVAAEKPVDAHDDDGHFRWAEKREEKRSEKRRERGDRADRSNRADKRGEEELN